MDLLKKIWPTAFGVKKNDVTALVVQIIVLLVVCIIASVLIWILAKLPIVGWIVGIFGGIVDLYCFIGIILCLLNFFDVLKS